MSGGCRPSQPGAATPQIISLKVACSPGQVAAAITYACQVWALQNNAQVELVTATGEPRGETADIWLIPPAELPHAAAAQRLRPVPDSYLKPDHPYGWLDILPIYRHKLLTWAGKVWALPIRGSAPLCFYRDDWLRDPANQTRFREKYGRPLGAPNTWDDYADIAEFFHHHPRANATAPSPSLTPLSLNGHDLDRDFYGIAAPLSRLGIREDDKKPPPDAEVFSFHFDVNTGECRIDRPGCLAALRLLQRLQYCRPAEPSAQPEQTFRAGRAALCLTNAEWISRFQEEGSPVRDRFSVCRVPGSRRLFDYQTGAATEQTEINYVPYLGADGLLAVVPRDAAHPDKAFALIAELSSPQTSAEIALGTTLGGGAFRNSHLALFAKGSAFELDSSRTQALVEQLRLTLAPPIINPLVRLRTPNQEQHFRSLAKALRSVLSGQTKPQAALEGVAKEWRQINKVEGLDSFLADYRLSLGLAPKR
jgi:multiple sugar transport system substrate-binding protein